MNAHVKQALIDHERTRLCHVYQLLRELCDEIELLSGEHGEEYHAATVEDSNPISRDARLADTIADLNSIAPFATMRLVCANKVTP